MKTPKLTEEENDTWALIFFIVTMIVLIGSFYYHNIQSRSWGTLTIVTILLIVTARFAFKSLAYFFEKLDDLDDDY